MKIRWNRKLDHMRDKRTWWWLLFFMAALSSGAAFIRVFQPPGWVQFWLIPGIAFIAAIPLPFVPVLGEDGKRRARITFERGS